MTLKRFSALFVVFVSLFFATSCQILPIPEPAAISEDPSDPLEETAPEQPAVEAEPTAAPTPSIEQRTTLDPDRPLRIVVVQQGRCDDDSYWCPVEQGLQDAAADLGIAIEITGPITNDTTSMAQYFEAAVASQPDGIAFTVPDSDALRGAALKAIEADIPLIAYSIGNGPDIDNIPYLTLYAQDDYLSGFSAAEKLIEAADGNTDLAVCINHAIGEMWGDNRCQGFLDAMSAYGVEAEILGISEDAGVSSLVIKDYLSVNPNADLFLTLESTGANPFYLAMEELTTDPDSYTHGSFGLSPQIVDNIWTGRTAFGIDTQPYLQGYGAVYSLALAARYGILPAEPITSTGPGFIEADLITNVRSPESSLRVIAVQHARCDWDSFWCVVENGAQLAAANHDIDLEIYGPDEFDLDRVAELINQAVDEEPDGLMVTVTDAELFREPLMRAIDKGIPVVAYNAGKGPEVDEIPYLTLLAQDEFLAGYLAGKRLVSAAQDQGLGNLAVCINHLEGAFVTEARCEGYSLAMEEEGIPLEILYTNDDAGESFARISDFYALNPNTDIFLTIGPASAHPYYSFLASQNFEPNSFVHGTFDLSPEISANIEGGTTLFGIDQQPFLQGYGAVQTLELLLRHGVSPTNATTPTGPGFVTISNIGTVSQLAGEYR